MLNDSYKFIYNIKELKREINLCYICENYIFAT